MKHRPIKYEQALLAVNLGLLDDVSDTNITRRMLASIRAVSDRYLEIYHQFVDGYLMVDTGDSLCKLYRLPDIYEMIELLINKGALPNGVSIKPCVKMHERLYDVIDTGLRWLQTQNS